MKSKDLLLDDETLFRDETVFTPSYLPEDFIHRDDQLKGLSFSLKPGLRGVAPLNTLLYGPPGTGKTTAVKYIFNQVRETTGKLIPVYVNCEDSNTRFSVFSRIHEAVYGHAPPDTGKPLDAVKEKIFAKLKKEEKTLAVALDEIDHLFLRKNADKILVDLLKSHTTYGYDKVGVIGVLIDDKFMSNLDVKTRSVFNPERVYFPPYNRDEIRDILSARIKHGLYPSVLNKNVLEEIIDKTLSQGDLRVGLDLIRRSAYLAEQDASRAITKEYVDRAFEGYSSKLNLKKTVDSLDEIEKKLLGILLSGETNSGKIYELFNKETKTGIKKYNEIISKLEHYKLVDAPYSVGARGRSRNIMLRCDSSELRELL